MNYHCSPKLGLANQLFPIRLPGVVQVKLLECRARDEGSFDVYICSSFFLIPQLDKIISGSQVLQPLHHTVLVVHATLNY